MVLEIVKKLSEEDVILVTDSVVHNYLFNFAELVFCRDPKERDMFLPGDNVVMEIEVTDTDLKASYPFKDYVIDLEGLHKSVYSSILPEGDYFVNLVCGQEVGGGEPTGWYFTKGEYGTCISEDSKTYLYLDWAFNPLIEAESKVDQGDSRKGKQFVIEFVYDIYEESFYANINLIGHKNLDDYLSKIELDTEVLTRFFPSEAQKTYCIDDEDARFVYVGVYHA